MEHHSDNELSARKFCALSLFAYQVAFHPLFVSPPLGGMTSTSSLLCAIRNTKQENIKTKKIFVYPKHENKSVRKYNRRD